MEGGGGGLEGDSLEGGSVKRVDFAGGSLGEDASQEAASKEAAWAGSLE